MSFYTIEIINSIFCCWLDEKEGHQIENKAGESLLHFYLSLSFILWFWCKSPTFPSINFEIGINCQNNLSSIKAAKVKDKIIFFSIVHCKVFSFLEFIKNFGNSYFKKYFFIFNNFIWILKFLTQIHHYSRLISFGRLPCAGVKPRLPGWKSST